MDALYHEPQRQSSATIARAMATFKPIAQHFALVEPAQADVAITVVNQDI